MEMKTKLTKLKEDRSKIGRSDYYKIVQEMQNKKINQTIIERDKIIIRTKNISSNNNKSNCGS